MEPDATKRPPILFSDWWAATAGPGGGPLFVVCGWGYLVVIHARLSSVMARRRRRGAGCIVKYGRSRSLLHSPRASCRCAPGGECVARVGLPMIAAAMPIHMVVLGGGHCIRPDRDDAVRRMGGARATGHSPVRPCPSISRSRFARHGCTRLLLAQFDCFDFRAAASATSRSTGRTGRCTPRPCISCTSGITSTR